MRPLRVAVLGCGGHSRSDHGEPLKAYATANPGHIARVAACDLDGGRAAAFCRDFGFETAFSDLDEMILASRPDALVCVMPVSLITPVAVRLLERGIPFVLEKPLASNAEEAARLLDATGRWKTPHMVSVNRRFLPQLAQALAWIREKGPVRHWRVCLLRRGRVEPEFSWATGFHGVDALRFMAGEPGPGAMPSSPAGAGDVPWVQGQFGMADGATAEVSLFPTAGKVVESYEAFGDGFGFRLALDGKGKSTLERWWGDGEELMETCPGPALEAMGALGETTHFISCMRNGQPPGPTIPEVLPSLHLAWALGGHGVTSPS